MKLTTSPIECWLSIKIWSLHQNIQYASKGTLLFLFFFISIISWCTKSLANNYNLFTHSIGNHSLHNFLTSATSDGPRNRSWTSCWMLSASGGWAVMSTVCGSLSFTATDMCQLPRSTLILCFMYISLQALFMKSCRWSKQFTECQLSQFEDQFPFSEKHNQTA